MLRSQADGSSASHIGKLITTVDDVSSKVGTAKQKVTPPVYPSSLSPLTRCLHSSRSCSTRISLTVMHTQFVQLPCHTTCRYAMRCTSLMLSFVTVHTHRSHQLDHLPPFSTVSPPRGHRPHEGPLGRRQGTAEDAEEAGT